MKLERDKQYIDRRERTWRVIDVDGLRIAPVTVARWEGKRYVTLTLQSDGRYYADGREDPADLMRAAPDSAALSYNGPSP